jgi:hypothetical protein
MARKQRPQKEFQPINYFIVEGCTEENYLNLLKRLYKNNSKVKNCKGGNAKGIMIDALNILKEKKEIYSKFIVWFDNDRFNPKNPEESKLYNTLLKEKTEIYISEPCIEAWLLAHFETVQHCKHKDCKACEEKLKIYIPNYEKNNCILLEKHINVNNICNAIKNYSKLGNLFKEYFTECLHLTK